MFGLFKSKKKKHEELPEEVEPEAEHSQEEAAAKDELSGEALDYITHKYQLVGEEVDTLGFAEEAPVEEAVKEPAQAKDKKPKAKTVSPSLRGGDADQVIQKSEATVDCHVADAPRNDEVAGGSEESKEDKDAPVSQEGDKAKAEEQPKEPQEKEASKGWLSRLKSGLSKTSGGISSGIGGIFTKRKLDDEMLEELEDVLIMADMGATTSAKIVASFSKGRFDKEIEPEEVKQALAGEIASLLEPVTKPFEVQKEAKPHVVLVVGVNGNGKTTTMGKLASRLQAEGHSVMMAAADTFRAAAVEQLKVWGERSGVEVISDKEGADAASVAYRAYEQAKKDGIDVLMIDTAGRLHNKNNLMQELKKIARVIKKIDDAAPHTVLQVLDGTTGQNALSQVEAFQKMIDVNAMVVTKLDGTAKGGVVVALAEKFGLPIHAVGVGESIDDLREFNAEDYAKGLVGL